MIDKHVDMGWQVGKWLYCLKVMKFVKLTALVVHNHTNGNFQMTIRSFSSWPGTVQNRDHFGLAIKKFTALYDHFPARQLPHHHQPEATVLPVLLACTLN